MREVTRCARRVGLEALTLYAFSSQNWARPAEEVAGLMELLRDYLEREREEILDNGIRLNAIGEVERLPRYVREPLERLREEKPAEHGDGAHPGAVLRRARGAAARGARPGGGGGARKVGLERLEPRDLERFLWTSGLPPVDLIVRTSGEYRLSTSSSGRRPMPARLHRRALARLPDGGLPARLAQFQQRERRFGLTSAQVKCEELPQRAKA